MFLSSAIVFLGQVLKIRTLPQRASGLVSILQLMISAVVNLRFSTTEIFMQLPYRVSPHSDTSAPPPQRQAVPILCTFVPRCVFIPGSCFWPHGLVRSLSANCGSIVTFFLFFRKRSFCAIEYLCFCPAQRLRFFPGVFFFCDVSRARARVYLYIVLLLRLDSYDNFREIGRRTPEIVISVLCFYFFVHRFRIVTIASLISSGAFRYKAKNSSYSVSVPFAR